MFFLVYFARTTASRNNPGITPRNNQSGRATVHVAICRFPPPSQTGDIMMSVFQKLPQQCEICLSCPVMRKPVSICLAWRSAPRLPHIHLCIIHSSSSPTRGSCISLNAHCKLTSAVKSIEGRVQSVTRRGSAAMPLARGCAPRVPSEERTWVGLGPWADGAWF